MLHTIVTKYKNYPGSNVGQYQARLRPSGSKRSLRPDQSMSPEQNHRRVAQKIADDLGLTLRGSGSAMNDGRYTFEAEG